MKLESCFQGYKYRLLKQWIWTLFGEVMSFQTFVIKLLVWSALTNKNGSTTSVKVPPYLVLNNNYFLKDH